MVTDVCSKYVYVIPLKDKNGIIITNAFHEVLNENGCKTKRIVSYIRRNFTIDWWNHQCKIMIWKYFQHITKENLLLLKDLLEPERTKYAFIPLQYKKLCVLII